MGRQADSWARASQQWAVEATRGLGCDPEKLQLLATAPLASNPAWRRCPSFAASALLPTTDTLLAHPLTKTARLLWALGRQDLFFALYTPYPHRVARQEQLLPIVLERALQDAARSRCSSSTSTEASEDDTAGSAAPEAQHDAVQQQQQRQTAELLFRQLAADMRVGAIRVFGWLLSLAFRRLFGGVVMCDTGSLARLQQLQKEHTLVIVAAHKSHIDYLIMSYVMFASGLPCPHIAAGANLSLPLVSSFLRANGAFFIRRTSHGGDADLYKRILAGYVHALLKEGQSLEWFIEGGRSRDGRIHPPKLGLLSYVMDSQLSGELPKPVLLVPATISFDLVLEERSLAAQLAGTPKKKESLWGLVTACWEVVCTALFDSGARRLGLAAGGICGRAAVSFGQPIPLQPFLQVQSKHELLMAGSSARKAAVSALGESIARSLCQCNVIMPSVLLVGSLLLQKALAQGLPALEAPCPAAEGGTTPGLAADMDWLSRELRQRGATTFGLPAEHQGQHLRRLASLLRGCVSSVEAEDGGQVIVLAEGTEARMRQHMRLNQLLPWLAAEGLVTAALLACSNSSAQPAAPLAQVLDSALWLRRVLGAEMDSALGAGVLQAPDSFLPVLQAMQLRGQVVLVGADKDSSSVCLAREEGPRRTALLAALLLSPLVASYAAVLQAVASELAGNSSDSSMSRKALSAAAQAALLQDASSSHHPLIVPSTALVQGAMSTLTLELNVLTPVRASHSGSCANGCLSAAPLQQQPSSSASEGSLDSKVSTCEPMASSMESGLCQLVEEKTATPRAAAEDELCLASNYRSMNAIQALLDRLRSFVPQST